MQPDPLVFIVVEDEALRGSMKSWLVNAGLRTRAYTSAQDFLDHYISGTPGCVVTGLNMHGMSSLQLQAKSKKESDNLSFVFVSSEDDVISAVAAMKAGALDVLVRPFSEQKFVELVSTACSGVLHSKYQNEIYDLGKRLAYLSPREQEVLRYVVVGAHTKSIARDIDISPRTVEAHRSSIMKKVGVKSLSELVRVAVAAGIEPPGMSKEHRKAD